MITVIKERSQITNYFVIMASSDINKKNLSVMRGFFLLTNG